MSSFRVSRRQLVGMVATAAAVVPALSSSPAAAAVASSDGEPAPGLVSPLQAGSPLGQWTIVAIGDVHAGALSVALRDTSGATFYVDICQRDDEPGAALPPARSDLYDLYLSNGGDGAAATLEGHGLATLALSEIVRSNEHSVHLEGMLTRRQRLARFPEQVAAGYKHLG